MLHIAFLSLVASAAPVEVDVTSTVPGDAIVDHVAPVPLIGARLLFPLQDGFISWTAGGAVSAGQEYVVGAFHDVGVGNRVYYEQGARVEANLAANGTFAQLGDVSFGGEIVGGFGVDAASENRALSSAPVISVIEALRCDFPLGGVRAGVLLGMSNAWVIGRPEVIGESNDFIGGVSVRF